MDQIDLTLDISDVVSDINDHPSVFNLEQTGQGNFCYRSDEKESYKSDQHRVNIDKEGIATLIWSTNALIDKKRVPKPEEKNFRYDAPGILMTIKGDDDGKKLLKALEAWAKKTDDRFIDNKGQDRYFVCLASETVYKNPYEEYTFDEAKELNATRLENIASLHEAVRSTLRVRQRRFTSLKKFIEEENNFHLHFRDIEGNYYRERPAYLRFKKHHPELERELTETLNEIYKQGQVKYRFWDPEHSFEKEGAKKDSIHEKHKQINEKLFEAYKLMSQFVFRCDEDVMNGGKPDREYLIR